MGAMSSTSTPARGQIARRPTVPRRGELWRVGEADDSGSRYGEHSSSERSPGHFPRSSRREKRLHDADFEGTGGHSPLEESSAHSPLVLVVQIDAFNESRIRTVVCAVVTDDLRLAAAPGNVLLRRHVSGLTRDMVCNVAQLITLEKAQLRERIGRLPPACVREVDAGLRLLLGT